MTTSTLITGAKKEARQHIPCIYYPIHFKKDTNKIQTLIDSKSEVNAIHSTFAQQLDLFIRPTNTEAQKIYGITLDIYKMVVAAFSIINKANWVKFFKKIFLVANISLEVVFGMFFLILSSINIDFLDWELWWRIYTT